ncbi:glucose-methanol-choline gmc oxidoreductase [Holotrichia oblita]|uniref:Glucose-methanol-choline gmc oxidoreductase n=1 Tax=Holotrichia oblita TaxID=644536 RepID=A0ACB9SID3_HOLOL|nr:glucose-methanol-choline gmc oxidoreductase [Holotrichia oblita]
MMSKLTNFLLVTLILALNYDESNSQGVQELIQEVKETILRLERSGKIKRDYEPYTEPVLLDEEGYDFVIVGAGSSGSALVHRLSEVSNWTILLLEAGGEPEIYTDIPFWSRLAEYTQLNWGYVSEKEDNIALGLKDQRIPLTRGKGIGGSSLINSLIYTRGTKEDYNRWESLGNPGWSYEDVLPYFKKLENCTIPIRDDLYRGHDGPISVQDAYQTKSGDVFIEAAENSGYKYVDYNGRTNKGVSYMQHNTKNGLRCSGESCYIRPIKHRKNLTIRKNSQVTKILIRNNTAYGVEFKNGRIYTAFANKEVILSAGAINSPQILLLSGIGPKHQLLKFGIKPIHNLPVGQKMHDHIAYSVLGYTFNDSITFNFSETLKDESFINLYNKGEGPLRSINTVQNILFTRSSFEPNLHRVTDVEIIGLSGHIVSSSNNTGEIEVTNAIYENTFKQYANQFVGSCAIALLHPKSYGRVELRSADPFVHPKIYTGFLTDPEGRDVKALIEGIREANRIMLSPAFEKYGIKPMDTPIYGCQQHEYDSDEYWECAIRHVAHSFFHYTTTCKMGPESDPEAVVDSKLKVHGMRRLRIVDTSIIPITLSAHTNLPAFMVGEKASDLIKEEYLLD